MVPHLAFLFYSKMFPTRQKKGYLLSTYHRWSSFLTNALVNIHNQPWKDTFMFQLWNKLPLRPSLKINSDIEKFLQWKLEYAKAQYLVLSKYTKWTTPFISCRVATCWTPPKRTNSWRLKRAHLSEKILWDPKVHTVLPPLFVYQSILLDFKHLLILFLTVFPTLIPFAIEMLLSRSPRCSHVSFLCVTLWVQLVIGLHEYGWGY